MEPQAGDSGQTRGEWTGDRPPPRFGTIIGAVGGLIVATGAYVLLEEVSNDAARIAGILISLALVAGGVFVTAQRSDGPAHLAGVAAAAVAVAPLVFFVVFDPDDFDGSKSSVSALLVLAGAIWAGLYFLGPSRGHAIFLGGALAAGWLVLMVQLVELEQVNPLSTLQLESEPAFDDPSEFEFQTDVDGDFSGEFGEGSTAFLADEPEPPGGGSDAGMVSLIVGAVYLAAAFGLGSRDLDRPATPFLAVGDVALTIGVFAVGGDAGATSGAFLAIGVGLALAWFASATGRRFTAWLGGLFVFGGLTVLIGEITDENNLTGGLLLLAVGAAVVIGAEAVTGPRRPNEVPPAPPPAPAP